MKNKTIFVSYLGSDYKFGELLIYIHRKRVNKEFNTIRKYALFIGWFANKQGIHVLMDNKIFYILNDNSTIHAWIKKVKI